MSLIDHLIELRHRLIVSLIAIAIGAIVAFIFFPSILRFLQHPYCVAVGKNKCSFLGTSVLDPFAIRIQVATYGGMILAAPVVFWQLWRFIAPGLKSKEKKYAIPFIVSSVILFAMGGVVAYLTFPKALEFLVNVGGHSIEVHPTPTKYLQLVLLMILAFGLSFEFPVLLVALELVGAVTSKKLGSWRRPAIVAIVTFAAVITPSQDPFSLFAMAIPMYIFYEGSIIIGKLLKK